MWNVTTKSFGGKGGALISLDGVETAWQKNPDGRYQPMDKQGTEFTLNTELVLLAMGFVGPKKGPLFDALNLAVTPRGSVRVDGNHMTDVDGVFAAGDISLGQSLIVSALADGRKTAASIIRYLEAH
jgi:glutamate synthase (NADPH/NADH) small chain